MSIPRRPFLPHSNVGQSSRGRLNGPILAVGRRVLVTCSSEGARRVTLTDSTGSTALATLADGAEVEILAWQPRGPGGTRYRIQPTAGAVQGWLSAANLRAPAVPAPPPTVGTFATPANGRGQQATPPAVAPGASPRSPAGRRSRKKTSRRAP